MPQCKWCLLNQATVTAWWKDKWGLDHAQLCDKCNIVAQRDPDYMDSEVLSADMEQHDVGNSQAT